MATTALVERYAANLHGVLSCYDRIIITGTLPGACYAGGMTSFLYSRGIRIFDYARFAEPLRDRVRQRAQEVAQANGAAIEHVNKSHVRKEDLVARVLAARGDARPVDPRPGRLHLSVGAAPAQPGSGRYARGGGVRLEVQPVDQVLPPRAPRTHRTPGRLAVRFVSSCAPQSI